MKKVLFTDNNGSGFSGMIDVDGNSTLASFLESRGVNANDYMVRVNRNVMASVDYLIQDGDRISLSPKKVAGA